MYSLPAPEHLRAYRQVDLNSPGHERLAHQLIGLLFTGTANLSPCCEGMPSNVKRCDCQGALDQQGSPLAWTRARFAAF